MDAGTWATGRTGLLALALAGTIVWLLSGFYTVGPNEVGLNRIFGRYTGKTAPGLNYNLPIPIGSVTGLPRAAISAFTAPRHEILFCKVTPKKASDNRPGPGSDLSWS